MKNKIMCFGILLMILATHSFSQSKKGIRFIEAYKESSIQVVNNTPMPLLKWRNGQTLNYVIIGECKFFNEKNWKKFLREVEVATQLRFNEVNSEKNAQIAVYFKPLLEYFEEIKYPHIDYVNPKFNNWSNRKYSKEYVLNAVSFCIAPEKLESLSHGTFLVRKLLLKSLGLLGEVDDEYSLFNSRKIQYNLEFKLNDKRIVKMHYMDEIKAGMKIETIDDVLINNIDLQLFLKEKIK